MIIKNYTDTEFLLTHYYATIDPMGDLVINSFNRDGEMITYIDVFYRENKNGINRIINKKISPKEIIFIWSVFKHRNRVT